uniref:DNA protecting protein DprA n=1 Tax=Cyanothece sp. (strain PCC 7425 / ATCC 29141) TaxID=395961 RepID=B8HQJ0_CYAP4
MGAEQAVWLAWSQIPGVGPVLIQRLQQRFGSLSEAWFAPPEALKTVAGIGQQTLEEIQSFRSKTDPEALFQQHSQTNPHFWTAADSSYPRILLEISDPPALLYYRGKVDLKENQGLNRMIAMVGTREPSDYGRRWTHRIATVLARNGFTVVSGLAEGIDTQAHISSLEAGGRTIAVVGTGVDLVYPPRNKFLYEKILQQGLVLSEYPAQTQPERSHFPRRNRIIAGLCRAVLVMEAPSKSGALITAHLANDYGRDVYILPGSLDNHRAIGCLKLINRGAQVILGEGHLLELLGTIPQLDQPPPRPDLAPDLATVLASLTQLTQDLSQSSVPFDLIVQTCGLDPGTASSALMQLELLGLINQLPGMRYQPL